MNVTTGMDATAKNAVVIAMIGETAAFATVAERSEMKITTGMRTTDFVAAAVLKKLSKPVLAPTATDLEPIRTHTRKGQAKEAQIPAQPVVEAGKR